MEFSGRRRRARGGRGPGGAQPGVARKAVSWQSAAWMSAMQVRGSLEVNLRPAVQPCQHCAAAARVLRMSALASTAGAVGGFFNRLAPRRNGGVSHSRGFLRCSGESQQGAQRFPIARLGRKRFHGLNCFPMAPFPVESRRPIRHTGRRAICAGPDVGIPSLRRGLTKRRPPVCLL